MVRTTGSSNGQNVRRIHQAKLNARHCATVAISEKNLLAETCEASKTAYFLNHAPARRSQNLDLLNELGFRQTPPFTVEAH
jgi:hypothetical protein